MLNQLVQGTLDKVATIRDALSTGALRASLAIDALPSDVQSYVKETEGITELGTMLVVAGVIVVGGAAAAVTILGGVNNTVNTIMTKL